MWLYSLLAATIVNGATEALLPLVWKYLIDAVIVPQKVEGLVHALHFSIPFAMIINFVAVYALLLISNAISERYMILLSGKLRHYVIRDLRSQMFAKMQLLPYQYYDKTSAGWLVARLTYDTERLSEVMSWGLINFSGAIVMIAACLISMFMLNVPLTLIVMVSIPMVLIVSLKLRTIVLKFARESRRLNSELTGYFTENLNAIELVKANAIEEFRNSGFYDINNRLKKASLKTSVYSSFFNPVMVLLGSFVAAIIMFTGGKMAFVAGTISIGTFGAFFAYVRNIFMPVFDISRTYASAISSLSAGERIFSLIDEPVTIKDCLNATTDFSLTGDIRFDGVNFGYLPNQKVLRDFNLHIRPGESVALVGPSGEGKTTIISLICRFYEPVSGAILANDIDIKALSISAYLRQIGVIPQVPHIFSGTVKSNITFSCPDATDKDIFETLELIGAEYLISRLNDQIGNEGDSLSNGEKQMISFARVIIKKPRILIMDEATSSMDAITELRIKECINRIIKGRTAIIIAHRLSTIRGCDRILFIKDGNIAEQGNHEYLMEAKGHYHSYYKSYSRGVE
ncbi:MAG: ABC transporter ATP-binding protein [Bacteroidales bacterium]|nr:ABC transporter ATP-binding protein [Bacteroidales bacterium]